MFQIDAETETGGKLQVPGDFEIQVSSDLAGEQVDENGFPIYTLLLLSDRTGRWNEESKLVPMEEGEGGRRKRQLPGGGAGAYTATIKGIPIERQWYNFDAISQSTCYSKIRVYDIDGETPLSRVSVGVIHKSPSDGNALSTKRAYTDNAFGDSNGYCIAHPCDNDLRPSSTFFDLSGYVYADKYGVDLEPVMADDLTWNPTSLAGFLNYDTHNDTISSDFHLRNTDNSGPLYNWNRNKWIYSDPCSEASSSENSFDFIARLRDCEITVPDPINNDANTGDFSECKVERFRQLYGYLSLLGGDVRSCYIKVYAPGRDDDIFYAFSNVGPYTSNQYVSPLNPYGYSLNCVKHGFTCLEVKVPGQIACSNTEGDYFNDNLTTVAIWPNAFEPPVLEVNPKFSEEGITVHRSGAEFMFDLTDFMDDGNWGIFCEDGEDVESTRQLAKQKCFQSDNDQWAVKFAGKCMQTLLFHI